MNDIAIAATKNTPAIFSEIAQQRITIRGEAYPENAAQFYAPFFTWLNDYLEEKRHQATELNVELTYFNSSSSKVLFDLFERLEQAVAVGHQVVVNWRFHSDNDMIQEYGEEFAEEVKGLDFRLLAYDDNDQDACATPRTAAPSATAHHHEAPR